MFQFNLVQSLSCVWFFVTPWITAHQASLIITNSRNSPKLTCIESVMPSSHLIHCRPLLLLTLIPPSNMVFSNESTRRIRWPKYWSFSLSISPSMNTQDWYPLGWTGMFRVSLTPVWSRLVAHQDEWEADVHELCGKAVFTMFCQFLAWGNVDTVVISHSVISQEKL